MFELGREIREKYVKNLKFLSSTYNKNEMYSRSSHYRRTISSAKSFLAGIYCESHTDQPNGIYTLTLK